MRNNVLYENYLFNRSFKGRTNQNNLKISSCVILINFKTYQDSRNAGKNGNAFLKTIREVINY